MKDIPIQPNDDNEFASLFDKNPLETLHDGINPYIPPVILDLSQINLDAYTEEELLEIVRQTIAEGRNSEFATSKIPSVEDNIEDDVRTVLGVDLDMELINALIAQKELHRTRLMNLTRNGGLASIQQYYQVDSIGEDEAYKHYRITLLADANNKQIVEYTVAKTDPQSTMLVSGSSSTYIVPTTDERMIKIEIVSGRKETTDIKIEFVEEG